MWLAALLVGLVLVCGCKSEQKPQPVKDDPMVTVSVSGSADVSWPEAPGTLLVSWVRQEERDRLRDGWRPGLPLFVPLLKRSMVWQHQRLVPGGIRMLIKRPKGSWLPIAMLAPEGTALGALWSGRGQGVLVGAGALMQPLGGNATVELSQALPPADRSHGCKGERLELIELDVPETVGSIGNDSLRRLCVLVPKSYEGSKTRYPVVYGFPGLGGSVDRPVTDKYGVQALEQLATSQGREVIVVGVGTRTKTGASYFQDSPVTGAWDSYLSRMVTEVDERLRTVAEPRGRALMGKSTGGFTAISVALRHTELFGAAAAAAPDGLDLAGWLLGDDSTLKPEWLAWMRLEDANGAPGQFVSYAADWSFDAADAGSKPGYSWPFNLRTGRKVYEHYGRWLSHSPMELLKDKKILAAVREKLSGRIYFNVGRDDEFGLHDPAKTFSAKLTELGVTHRFEVMDGGHDSPHIVGPAMAAAIRMVTEDPAPPAPSASVPPPEAHKATGSVP